MSRDEITIADYEDFSDTLAFLEIATGLLWDLMVLNEPAEKRLAEARQKFEREFNDFAER